MSWQWSLEGGAFVLRFAPLPAGVAEFGVVGRSLTPAAPGPLGDRAAVRLDQVHGSAVRRAEGIGSLAGCDGVVSGVPGLVLTVRVADCLPVLLASPDSGIALVHAGWRGLAAGILEKAVAHFRKPARLRALFGPAIGPCCFEVGAEVAGRFPGDVSFPRSAGRPHVDLFAAAARRLVAAGVAPAGIAGAALCTRCHQHLLHSHRGSGGAGGRNVTYAVVAPPDQHEA